VGKLDAATTINKQSAGSSSQRISRKLYQIIQPTRKPGKGKLTHRISKCRIVRTIEQGEMIDYIISWGFGTGLILGILIAWFFIFYCDPYPSQKTKAARYWKKIRKAQRESGR